MHSPIRLPKWEKARRAGRTTVSVHEPANQLGLREDVPVHRAFEILFPGVGVKLALA